MTDETILITNIARRDLEVENYQLNIDTYTQALLDLPEWTEELLQYRKADPATLDIAIAEQVAELQFRDKLTKTLLTEKIEQKKAHTIRNALATNAVNAGVTDLESKVDAEKIALKTPVTQ